MSDKVNLLIQEVLLEDPSECTSGTKITGSIPISESSSFTSDDDAIKMIIGPDTTRGSESYSYMKNTTTSINNFNDTMSVDLSKANDAM